MRIVFLFIAAALLAGCRVSASTELYIQDAREWLSRGEQVALPLQISAFVTGSVADCERTYWPQIAPVVERYFQKAKFLGCEERQGAIENLLKLEAEIGVVTRSTTNVPGLLAVSLAPREVNINDGLKRQGVEVQIHANPEAASRLADELRSVNPLINLNVDAMRIAVLVNNDTKGTVDFVARAVFVNEAPSDVLGELKTVERRKRADIRLSDVQTAWLLSKGSAVAAVILHDRIEN